MSTVTSSVAHRQAATFNRLWEQIEPYVTTDQALPARFEGLLRQHRQFGSRDRRLYRELFYTTVRYWPWITTHSGTLTELSLKLVVWLCAPTAASSPLKAALTPNWPELPSTVAARAAAALAEGITSATESLLPPWFRSECPESFEPPLYDVLNQRSALWLRLQTEDSRRVAEEFTERGWSWIVSPQVPSAWKMLVEADITTTEAYQNGMIEVQDLGSQWVLAEAGVQPGERWLDACAGAGGKTLQLSRLVGPRGKVVAHDIRSGALNELRERSARARLGNVQVTAKPEGGFDGVLIDTPCSGTGTWRRSPHLKWSTSRVTLATMNRSQEQILARYATLVRPGGRLVYATCSLASGENESVVRRFLDQHADFEALEPPLIVLAGAKESTPGRTLLPSLFDTDGFYMALLQRR